MTATIQRHQLAGLFAAGLAVLSLVALLTPWWTASVHVSGIDNSQSARPFDDGNGMIDNGAAVLSGILVLLALLLSIGAAILLFMRSAFSRLASVLVAGCVLLFILTAILAWTTWPNNGVSFWDSKSQSSGLGNVTISTYAAFGWYTAAVAGLYGAFVAIRAFNVDPSAPWMPSAAGQPAPVGYATAAPEAYAVAAPVRAPAASSPKPAKAVSAPATSSPAVQKAVKAPAVSDGQCTANTKSGSRCARKATSGAFCATHAA